MVFRNLVRPTIGFVILATAWACGDRQRLGDERSAGGETASSSKAPAGGSAAASTTAPGAAALAGRDAPKSQQLSGAVLKSGYKGPTMNIGGAIVPLRPLDSLNREIVDTLAEIVGKQMDGIPRVRDDSAKAFAARALRDVDALIEDTEKRFGRRGEPEFWDHVVSEVRSMLVQFGRAKSDRRRDLAIPYQRALGQLLMLRHQTLQWNPYR
jgi:hypothetical protein